MNFRTRQQQIDLHSINELAMINLPRPRRFLDKILRRPITTRLGALPVYVEEARQIIATSMLRFN
jgi:hypothetical protein